MRIKLTWKIGAVIGLVAIISMAAVGISYAANGNPNPSGKTLCTFTWAESNDNNSIRAGVDPDDNGQDPRAPQVKGTSTTRFATNAASTSISGDPGTTLTLALNGAYPDYNPTVFFGVSNKWNTPGIVQSFNIQNPPSYEVILTGISVNQIIESNTEAVGTLSVLAKSSLQEGQVQSITVGIMVTQYTAKGTLNITTPSLPNGEQGVVYTQYLAAAMGNLPYTWSLASGSLPLPTGLTLNAAGVIGGSPTAIGTFNFTVKVTDDTLDTATKALSIKILAGPTITTASLVDGKTGKSYSQTLAVSGGIAPYTWSLASGTLPTGLTLNPATGVIGGTPTKAGPFNFSIKVQDVYGAFSIKSFTITVK